MLGLRLTEGISLSHLTAEFGQETVNQILKILQPFITKNWVTILSIGGDHRIALTDPEGLLFSNTILSELFQYLDTGL